MCQKKVEKKVIFIFANFFFKIHFGHFFMSNFKIKKKVLKTPSFSIFRLLGNYHLSPENRYFVFFYGNRIFGGTFDNLHFFNPIMFYLNKFFVLFYFINEKIYYYKIFFHYKCSYKLSTVIQKILNFIQKLSNRSEKNKKKIKKIPKNPEKIRFFHFFSYALIPVFVKCRLII